MKSKTIVSGITSKTREAKPTCKFIIFQETTVSGQAITPPTFNVALDMDDGVPRFIQAAPNTPRVGLGPMFKLGPFRSKEKAVEGLQNWLMEVTEMRRATA